ncbi:hypothetical protein D3C71_767010 [compost metagenome]
MQIDGVVEGAAGIDEHRRAPRAAIEVMLVFGRAHHHVLGTQRVLVRGRRARAHFAVGVATDGTVTTGEITQAGWHRHQIAGPGAAGLAAQDQAVGIAYRDVPAQGHVGLDETGVRAGALDAAAHGDVAADATARKTLVVHVHVVAGQLRVDQRGVLVQPPVEGIAGVVAPALAQGVHRDDGGPVLVDLAAAAGDELHVAQVDVVGLLVVGADRVGVPAVQPTEARHAVAGDQALAPLRVIHLGIELVTTAVDVTPLHATAHTGATLAAEADTGGVDGALGFGQLHVHRHIAVFVGIFGVRLDVDDAEVVQLGQRLTQAVELAFVPVAAFFPVHQRVEQPGTEVILLEADRPHVVAAAAVPAEEDVGRVLGAGDFHLALGEVGIEITTLGQAPGDGDLAGLVVDRIERLPGLGLERLQVLLQVAVARGRAGDDHLILAHLDLLALVDLDRHLQVVAVARRLHGDGRVVVAERLQRLAGLALGLRQQVLQARLALDLADHVIQRQRGLDVLEDGGVIALVQALDVHLLDGTAGMGEGRYEERGEGQESENLWQHVNKHTDALREGLRHHVAFTALVKLS